MARNLFGGTADSVAEDITGARVPNAVGTVWDGPSAGAGQLTDLTDINGAPILQLQADVHGYVAAFYGPDGYERLWVDFGGGRVALVSVTIGERLDSHVNGIDPHGDRAYSDAQLNAQKAISSGIHGVTGSVVGTTDTQTLTNKTINGGVLSGTFTGAPVHSGNPTFSGNPQYTGLPKFSQSAAGNDAFGINVSGDAFDRVRVTTDGKISWGSGTASRDTTLYRTAVNALKTDGALSVVGMLTASGGATFTTAAPLSQAATSGTTAFRATAVGDTTDRFQMKGSGLLEWGDGTNARDTNLYRSAADTLKTDDSLVVTGNLTAGNITTGAQGTWTPTWSTTSGAHLPSFGNATIACYYAKVGRMVFFNFDITFGSTTNFGSGATGSDNWTFSVPVTAARAGTACGMAVYRVGSSSSTMGHIQIGSSDTTTFQLYLDAGNPGATATANIGVVDAITPVTWASGDRIVATGFYEAVS
ncbi:hypothetical protein [Streptomyces sp. 1222.5]|uniref:hypothetical protein n=1 Tax=Streptomyces sp. 1222.5 TaxID=1881026 RepID=UPI003EC0E92F